MSGASEEGHVASGTAAERVREIVADQLGVERELVVPEAHLLDDLQGDSLDLVELIMAIEEEFGIEISDEEAQNLPTVGAIVAFVEEAKGR